MSDKRRLLIISQVYVPDPAAVGQYMHDLAARMVQRGWQVIVFTANRGYDEPSEKYKKKEVLEGVVIKRFPFSSFGKNSMFLRILAAAMFISQAFLQGLLTPNLNTILVSTSPPMASLAAVTISAFRKIKIVYWVMDINPDQAIILGLFGKDSIRVKIFNRLNRLTLNRAEEIVTLDEDMKLSLMKKLDVSEKISIIPPWPNQQHLGLSLKKNNLFRQRHDLSDKFIFMYSGNHSLAHPLNTFTEAALALQEVESVLFMFIGGGQGKTAINKLISMEKPANIISLPYQPLAETRHSLASADVHLVSIGEKMVGVVHPSKIYGALAIGRPILLLGPANCRLGVLIRDNRLGWQVEHGDTAGTVELIRQIIAMPRARLNEMGKRARQLTEKEYSRTVLLRRFSDILASKE